MAAMRDGIVKRGSTYSYVVRELDPSTGKTKQRWRGGFKTRAAAVQARDEARVAARRRENVAPSRQTLGDYLLAWVEQADVKPKTRAGYRYNITQYVVPRLGGVVLQDLRPATLSAFYTNLHRNGGRDGAPLGWSSVHSVHRTLSTALTAAVRAQSIHTNPAQRAALPPRPRASTREAREAEQMKVLAPDQLRSFLDRAMQHRLGPLFHLAAYTGARRGELLHLRWNDVDLDRGRVHIFGTRSLADGEVVEGTPKGGRARTVGLDQQTVEVLRTLRAQQAEERLEAGPLWHTTDYLFTTTVGAPIHPDTPSGMMRRLCDHAGVPRRRFHDLRHTHATILLSAGVPPHEVADRLGHADATITMRVYASVLRDRANGLGDAFAAALESAC